MTFAHPYLLLLLLLLPALAWLKGKRGEPPSFLYSSAQLVRGLVNITRYRAGGFLAALRWLALALFIVALAQPRLTKSETKITASGVDIVVAFDLSLVHFFMDHYCFCVSALITKTFAFHLVSFRCGHD